MPAAWSAWGQGAWWRPLLAASHIPRVSLEGSDPDGVILGGGQIWMGSECLLVRDQDAMRDQGGDIHTCAYGRVDQWNIPKHQCFEQFIGLLGVKRGELCFLISCEGCKIRVLGEGETSAHTLLAKPLRGGTNRGRGIFARPILAGAGGLVVWNLDACCDRDTTVFGEN